ncbi:MAG: hypothetical protein ABFC96_15285 [Thermoguttaceae bacterium]
MFTVQFRFRQGGGAELTSPIIMATAGKQVVCSEVEKKTLSIGKSLGKHAGVVKELPEGFVAHATILAHGDGTAILDLSVELSGLSPDAGNGEPGYLSARYRQIQCVTLGKPVKNKFGDSEVEVVVEIAADQAAPPTPAAEKPPKQK